MAASIDNYLRNLASDYYLKNKSSETVAIEASVSALFKNLDKELGGRIKTKFVFGSYDRDTILPRRFDSKSDVDIMIVFNHTEYERTPATYRLWLNNFAIKYYKDKYGSDVEKTFPTVTIRLNHIHYDLVPAKEEELFWFGKSLYIPDGDGWRTTDPNDVKNKLSQVNTSYNQIVRPVIRILKAWNAYNGYPFESYLLESEIIKMNFYNDNVQTGLFYAAQQLGGSSGTTIKSAKIQSLRYNLDQVKSYLEANNLEKAKHWLHRILPTP